jgi:hypothetical protein
VRVGTWNMAGRWGPDHNRFLHEANCDVWLLTEVSERVELDGAHRHLSVGLVTAKRRWAGILSRRPLSPLPDPHVASAAAAIDGTTYCSSILPWRSSPGEPTWPGANHAQKTAHAVEQLVRALKGTDLVWGGDWNHSLQGIEGAGSKGGRQHVLQAVETFGLVVPTATLPHRLDKFRSIDHLAVGPHRVIAPVVQIDATGLSDHDAYVVDLVDGMDEAAS